MMPLKDEYNGCILLQAIQNPFVEIAIKRPYRNSHFIPAVCNVQKAFKAATKGIKSTAHLVLFLYWSTTTLEQFVLFIHKT